MGKRKPLTDHSTICSSPRYLLSLSRTFSILLRSLSPLQPHSRRSPRNLCGCNQSESRGRLLPRHCICQDATFRSRVEGLRSRVISMSWMRRKMIVAGEEFGRRKQRGAPRLPMKREGTNTCLVLRSMLLMAVKSSHWSIEVDVRSREIPSHPHSEWLMTSV